MGEARRRQQFHIKQEALIEERIFEERKRELFKRRSDAAKRGAETRRMNRICVGTGNMAVSFKLYGEAVARIQNDNNNEVVQ